MISSIYNNHFIRPEDVDVVFTILSANEILRLPLHERFKHRIKLRDKMINLSLTFLTAFVVSAIFVKYFLKANNEIPRQRPQPTPVKNDKLKSIFCLVRMVAL